MFSKLSLMDLSALRKEDGDKMEKELDESWGTYIASVTM
jgi:hypothetical protein